MEQFGPPYLDPSNQAVLDQFAGQPPFEDLSVQQFRELATKFQSGFTPASGINRTSFTVPSSFGEVKAYIFRPSTARGTLPTIFYFHGGGWISGDVDGYDVTVRDLASQTGCAVVFVEYTLSPEAKFPAQHEQCYAVTKWVFEHGEKKGLSQRKLAIVADSAGGQLATAVSILSATRHPKIPVAYQALISPVASVKTDVNLTLSEFLFFNGPFLTVPFIRKCIELTFPIKKDRESELATSLNISAKHAKLMPPTFISVASTDLLRDEAVKLGEILQKAGVEVVIIRTEGQIHDSLVFNATRTSPTPRSVFSLVTKLLKDALETKGIKKRGTEEDEADRETEPTRNKRTRL